MKNPEWKDQCDNPDSAFLGLPDFKKFCEYQGWGLDIVTTAIFSIVLGSTIGAIVIDKLGPIWLTQVGR